MKFAEDPKSDTKRNKDSGNNGDPSNHKTRIAGAIRGVPTVRGSRNSEPTKAQDARSAGFAASNVAAHNEDEFFKSTSRP